MTEIQGISNKEFFRILKIAIRIGQKDKEQEKVKIE
jgi:hypothetical protein